MEAFDAEQALDCMQRYAVTRAVRSTMFVRMLRLREASRLRFCTTPSTLQRVVHAAAPCPPEIKRQMIKWWPSSMVPTVIGGCGDLDFIRAGAG